MVARQGRHEDQVGQARPSTERQREKGRRASGQSRGSYFLQPPSWLHILLQLAWSLSASPRPSSARANCTVPEGTRALPDIRKSCKCFLEMFRDQMKAVTPPPMSILVPSFRFPLPSSSLSFGQCQLQLSSPGPYRELAWHLQKARSPIIRPDGGQCRSGRPSHSQNFTFHSCHRVSPGAPYLTWRAAGSWQEGALPSHQVVSINGMPAGC